MSQRLRAALASHLVALSTKVDRIIELSKVDLGEGREDYDYSVPYVSGVERPKIKTKWYPKLRIYSTAADLKDVPNVGKALVDYKIVERTTRTDEHDKKSHSYEIEIQSIDSQASEKKDAAAKKAGKAVALSDLRPGMIRFDARARNGQGEYAATDGGTITPNQASAAYGHPEEREVISPAAGRLTGQALLRKIMRR